MTGVVIETARLRLRNMARSDAAALRDIVTAPDVGRMLFYFPPGWSVSAAEDFIDTTAFRGTLPFRFGIYLEGALIGSVGAAPPNGETPVPNIFYFLAPAAHGQGFGSEAVRAFVTFLFDRFNMPEIGADVFHDNPASMRVLTGIGFVPAGEGMATSAARLEPAPVTLYRLCNGAVKASL